MRSRGPDSRGSDSRRGPDSPRGPEARPRAPERPQKPDTRPRWEALDAPAAEPADAPEAEAEPTTLRQPTPPEPPEPRDPDGEDVFAGAVDEAPPRGVLANVAGVKFAAAGTIHEYDAGDAAYARGERVVVETERGPLLATVAVPSRRRPMLDTLRRIVRRGDLNDERARDRNSQRERDALRFCKQRIRERGLHMKLVRVEYPLGQGKVLFYFAAEERIDFRDLVRDLAQRVHARVEMRQIGARDEAKLVGGIGSCGRELCCSTWLPAFVPVSIKMAKDQGLVLNPSKVSGQCGRLKCCLVYEQDTYKEMRKGMPKVGKRVTTPAGDGKVVELDVLRQRVRVWFDEGGSETFPADVVRLHAPLDARAPEPEAEPETDADPEPGSS